MGKVGSRRRTAWRPDKDGRYARQLGWKLNEQGKLVQHKFYLGTDERQAERRNHKLEELWDRVEELWGQVVHLPGNEQPIWEKLSLEIGKRLAKGEAEYPVPYSHEDPAHYARNIHALNKKFPMVRFVPENYELYRSGAEFTKGLVDEEIAIILGAAEQFGNLPNKPVAPAGDGSLHQALDDYIEWLKREQREPGMDAIKAGGWTQIREAGRLKEKHPDTPLSSLDLEAIESMIRLWRSRPKVKGKERSMAKVTADNHLAQMKRFLRWLHKSPRHNWRKPEGFEDLHFCAPLTAGEISGLADPEQVDTFDLAELVHLYPYTSEVNRAAFLLGLNCGFGAAECGSLRLKEIYLCQQHPKADKIGWSADPKGSFIFRVRRKSKVYGEWLLWPETVDALRYMIDRRQRIGNASPDSLLFVTKDGSPMYRQTEGGNNGQQIPKMWGYVLKNARAAHPEVRKLSFNKLRKTGGNFIKHAPGSDGEVAGVFLCHGHPVTSDELSDAYTNRPWKRVFEAIQKVREQLAPMFASKITSRSPQLF
jgi:integrase